MAAERLMRIMEQWAAAGSTSASLCEVAAAVTGLGGAGVMLVFDGVPNASLCSSDPISALLEEVQYTLGEGPCVDAHRFGVVVVEPDLANARTPRWVDFTDRALDAGVGAVFGYPIRLGSVRLGALNLYRAQSGVLDDDQHADALVLADLAARTILGSQVDGQPSGVPGGVVQSEDDAYVWGVVHQAAGMISVQVDVSLAEALVRLRSRAFSVGRSVSAVACDVVDRRLRFDEEEQR